MIGVIAHSVDRLLLHVMHDDRLFGQQDEFRRLIYETCDYVLGLSKTIWIRFASLQDIIDDANELRQLVVRAELAFCAGVRKNILDRLDEPPFSLLIGDRVANLAFRDTLHPPRRIAGSLQDLGPPQKAGAYRKGSRRP